MISTMDIPNIPGMGNIPGNIPPQYAYSNNQMPTFTGPVDGYQRNTPPVEPPIMSRPNFAQGSGSMGTSGAQTPAPATRTDPQPSPSGDWVTVSGSHNGTNFQVSTPPGWKVVNTPTTVLLVSPNDPNAVVSLMWLNGMGAMDPRSLLNNTIQYNGIRDYNTLNTTPIQQYQTPNGSYRMMEQDGAYTYKGEYCRHHATSIINDSGDPYMTFWSGSIIWNQAPAGKWEQYSQTLSQISGSFRVMPPSPAPPSPPPIDGGYAGGYTGGGAPPPIKF
jgi:hypothetical protein